MTNITYGAVRFDNSTPYTSRSTDQPSAPQADSTDDSKGQPKVRVIVQRKTYHVTRSFSVTQMSSLSDSSEPAINQEVDDAVNKAIYGEALNS